VVAVEDTGPGIAPENLPHVFNPYWQARQTARLGAGLGLAIAKGIVEAHGGRIWAVSTPGRGSTFAFALPVAVDAGEGGAA
jgi:signal transduction histidine kinase